MVPVPEKASAASSTEHSKQYDQTLFDPPRWRGGPIICIKENLPAFLTKDLALAWLQGPNKTNPQYEVPHIKRIGRCEFCGWWHMLLKPRDPAGSSSGRGRSSKEE